MKLEDKIPLAEKCMGWRYKKKVSTGLIMNCSYFVKQDGTGIKCKEWNPDTDKDLFLELLKSLSEMDRLVINYMNPNRVEPFNSEMLQTDIVIWALEHMEDICQAIVKIKREG